MIRACGFFAGRLFAGMSGEARWKGISPFQVHGDWDRFLPCLLACLLACMIPANAACTAACTGGA